MSCFANRECKSAFRDLPGVKLLQVDPYQKGWHFYCAPTGMRASDDTILTEASARDTASIKIGAQGGNKILEAGGKHPRDQRKLVICCEGPCHRVAIQRGWPSPPCRFLPSHGQPSHTDQVRVADHSFRGELHA